jgi:hypothetical protein
MVIAAFYLLRWFADTENRPFCGQEGNHGVQGGGILKMSGRLLTIAGCLALALASDALCFAQAQPTTTPQQPTQTVVTTKKTEAVQNPDGSWTVIEYPADKEVVIEFSPAAALATAKGRAKVIRTGDNTMINVDLSGLPAEVKTFNVYAVDPFGKATLLGPVEIANGVATKEFKTGMNRFMLVLSPETITTYAPTTSVAFRSNVPEGYAVIPIAQSDVDKGAAVGEKVSAVSTPGTTNAYTAPLLNVPGMKRGEDTEIKVKFTGALTGARANFIIEPRKDGPTTIKARFHELKEAPAGHLYTLWAVAPDGKLVKLGQIANTGQRNEAEIKSETALPDFGLLVTLEKGETTTPQGVVVGTFVP